MLLVTETEISALIDFSCFGDQVKSAEEVQTPCTSPENNRFATSLILIDIIFNILEVIVTCMTYKFFSWTRRTTC